MSLLNELYQRYKVEKNRWEKAGKPIRTPERMKEIYSICSACDNFLPGQGWMPGYDKCKVCQCNLHKSRHLLNKIAWATTHCPLEEPRWYADVDEDTSH